MTNTYLISLSLTLVLHSPIPHSRSPLPYPSLSFSTPLSLTLVLHSPIPHSRSPLPYPSLSFSTPPSLTLVLHSPIPHSRSPLPHPSLSFSTPPSLTLVLHSPIPHSRSPLPHPSLSFSTPPSLTLVLHSPIPHSRSPLPYPSLSFSTPLSLTLVLHSPIPHSRSPLPYPSLSFSTPSSLTLPPHTSRRNTVGQPTWLFLHIFLHISPLQFCWICTVCLSGNASNSKYWHIIYKAMHDLAPAYLSELLNQRTRHPQLQQLLNHLQLVVPSVSKSIGRRGFGTTGTAHWKALPLSLRDAPSLTLFKCKLKTHLFQCAYGNV